MPIAFKFVKVGQTEPTMIAEIDHLVCEMFGTEEDPERTSGPFDLLVMAGTCIVKDDGGPSTKEKVEKFLSENTFSDKLCTAIRRFMYKEYSFSAWRTSFY